MVVVILILAMGSQKLLLVGNRLKFAGIAARVIEPPPGVVSVKAFF
jgi:hypothetical protein